MAVDPLLWQSILVCNFDGTNGQTTFNDDGVKWRQKTLTGVAGAALTTTSPYFGTACLSLNGSSQRIDITDHTDFSFGTSDFTIEAWVYINGNSILDNATLRRTYIFSTVGAGSSNTFYSLMIDGDGTTTGTGLLFECYVSGTPANRLIAAPISQGAWHHICVSKNANGTYFGIDGTIYTTPAITQVVNRGQQPTIGGSALAGWLRWFNGKIDSLRILSGVALYTSDYKIPTAAYTTANSLLLHADGTNGTAVFTDNSTTPKTLTGYGTAQLSTTQFKFGTASIYLDGSSYIDLPMSSDFDFGSGDFTIDFWIYYTGAATGLYTIMTPSSAYGTTPWVIDISDGKVGTYFSTTGSDWGPLLRDSVSLTAAWNHVAVCRYGNKFMLFVNGRITSATANIALYSTPTSSVYIGRWASSTGNERYPTCYLDEIRIIKGTAAYTGSSYTVPTSAPDVNPTLNAGYVQEINKACTLGLPTFSIDKCGSTTGIMPSGTGNLVTGGSGYLNGIIKFRYPPDLPVKKKVGVFCETTGTFVKYTWSEEGTGAYRFDGLNPNLKYSVFAYDDTGTYGASVASGLIPTGY